MTAVPLLTRLFIAFLLVAYVRRKFNPASFARSAAGCDLPLILRCRVQPARAYSIGGVVTEEARAPDLESRKVIVIPRK